MKAERNARTRYEYTSVKFELITLIYQPLDCFGRLGLTCSALHQLFGTTDVQASISCDEDGL